MQGVRRIVSRSVQQRAADGAQSESATPLPVVNLDGPHYLESFVPLLTSGEACQRVACGVRELSCAFSRFQMRLQQVLPLTCSACLPPQLCAASRTGTWYS